LLGRNRFSVCRDLIDSATCLLKCSRNFGL